MPFAPSTPELFPEPTSRRRPGEVFTRRWVADLILDLVGYTADRDLAEMRALEPSCGGGAFLSPMVDRLMESASAHHRGPDELVPALGAFDLSEDNALLARKSVSVQLEDWGLGPADAANLADSWVRHGDFLKSDDPHVDIVVGNPPYVRIEDVDSGDLAEYRRRWPTMIGRADIYIGFIEASLRSLTEGGRIGFIVADRWMRNQYGGRLRELIGEEFAVRTVISMHDVDAFEEQVAAYPAVVVVERAAQGEVVVAHATAEFDEIAALGVSSWIADQRATLPTSVKAARTPQWYQGRASWPAGEPEHLDLLQRLDGELEPLESDVTGTRVGIGVASGLDRVFLTKSADLVEPDRLLPLARTFDTVGGDVEWSGTFLVNPWSDGQLVDLEDFPRLARYFYRHERDLKDRHIARRSPQQWYRTIDRVMPGLQQRPKLLIPDLKARLHPVREDGTTYPHHGLYTVTSDGWDLDVLGGYLLSDLANFFVGMHCVRMRGGCFRFQAQYLRRIKVPPKRLMTSSLMSDLAAAFRQQNGPLATELVSEALGLTEHECALLRAI